LKDFLAGAGCLLAGLKLLPVRGVRWYVVIPALVNILLFTLAILLTRQWVAALVERWVPESWGWIEPVIWLIFALLVVLVLFFGFILVGNLIGAPFNGLLSEAIERYLTDQEIAGFGWRQLAAEVGYAVLGELRKFAYFALLALPCLILLLIPGLNTLFPLVWFFLTAWMLSLEYLDYPAGNHQVRFKRLRGELKRNRLRALGLGVAILIVTAIPIVNFIAMPVGVAAATVYWLRFSTSGKTPAV
jgi:CysZ protein